MDIKKAFLLSVIVLLLNVTLWAHASMMDPIALTIAGEAGGEGYKGMYAVACVIQNRARINRISPEEVVSNGFYGKDNKVAITAYYAHKKVIDELVLKLRKGISLWDITNGAIYFENFEAFGRPKWTRYLRIKITKKIGQHTFFRILGRR